jgi:hypothetical protein
MHMAAGNAAAAQRDTDNALELGQIRDVLNGIRRQHAVTTDDVNDLRLRQRNFFMSVIVLRHELPENYISNGYDR